MQAFFKCRDMRGEALKSCSDDLSVTSKCQMHKSVGAVEAFLSSSENNKIDALTSPCTSN